MTTETLLLMGTVWGIHHLTFDLTFAVNRCELSSRPILKCQRQTAQSVGTSQTSSNVSRKSFNINRQVSVVKQGVSIRNFWYFE